MLYMQIEFNRPLILSAVCSFALNCNYIIFEFQIYKNNDGATNSSKHYKRYEDHKRTKHDLSGEYLRLRKKMLNFP